MEELVIIDRITFYCFFFCASAKREYIAMNGNGRHKWKSGMRNVVLMLRQEVQCSWKLSMLLLLH